MFDLGDITKLIGGDLSQGWDGIENAGKKAGLAPEADLQDQREEYLARARKVAAAFSTEDGKAALSILFSMTIGRPPSEEESGAVSEFQYVRAKALRDGQSNLVFTLFEMIRFARDAGAVPIVASPAQATEVKTAARKSKMARKSAGGKKRRG
jgi:hypothetical protein